MARPPTTSPSTEPGWRAGWALDLAVAALVALIVVIESLVPSDLHRGDPTLNLAINLASVLPLALRRHAPVLSLALVSAVIALPTLLVVHEPSFWGLLLGLGLSHYMVVRLRPVRIALPSLLFPVLGVGGYWLLTPSLRDDPGLAFFLPLIFGSSFLAGLLVRRDAERRAQLAVALDRLSDEEESRHRLAVLDERTALARDLHDVVAHALSLMNSSAGRARTALPTDLAAAEASVQALEAAGRDATAELRRMLGLLRESADVEPTEPAPGLDQLPAMIDRMRAAGLDIAFQPKDLVALADAPTGVQLAALRIVQEALTNALRHAGPTDVRLRVAAAIDGAGGSPMMIIEVIDAGPRARAAAVVVAVATAADGHGLIGMRERVGLYGGRLQAGRQGAGFAVRAELPFSSVAVVAAA